MMKFLKLIYVFVFIAFMTLVQNCDKTEEIALTDNTKALECNIDPNNPPTVSYLSTPEWSFYDNFEGTRDLNFWKGNGVYVSYGVDDPTRPGQNKVMAMTYIPNSEGNNDSWSEYDFNIGINAVQIEMGWKMHIPYNYERIDGNHKLYCLWSGNYGKSASNVSVSSEVWPRPTGGSASIYIGEDGHNYGHMMNSAYPIFWHNAHGNSKWIDVKVIVELAQQEGDYGKVELYLDNQFYSGTHHPNIIKAYSGAPTPSQALPYSSRGNYLDQGTLLGWANGRIIGFQQNTEFLIDDFYINANQNFGSINWAIH